jgi:hypothetical protein
MDEFWRMCKFLKWTKPYPVNEEKAKEIKYQCKRAHSQLKDAMVQQFNIIYGTDMEDINAWRYLCRVLEILPIPKGLKECQGVSGLDCSLI